MPGSSRAEIYFIAGMMLLIMLVCGAAVLSFFKTYRKEMRERAEQDSRAEEQTLLEDAAVTKGDVENA